MMTQYRTKDGDVIDQICFEHYGQTADVTEAVMKLNAHLLAYGDHLPSGLIVQLPAVEIQETPQSDSINLWD